MARLDKGSMFEIPIFWYSKYCRHCTEIIPRIDPNDFLFVCVDNVNIRKRLLTDVKYEIRSVPCLLVFQDRSFTKYEGDDVVAWLTTNDMFVPTTTWQPQEEEEAVVTAADHPQHPIVTRLPVIPEEVEEEPRMDTSTPLPTMLMQQPTPLPPPPPTTISQDDTEIDPSGMSDGMASTTPTPKKSDSVMTLAQQMQRERETADRPAPSSS